MFLLSKDVHMVMSLSVAVCHYYCLLCNTLCKGIFRKEFVFLVTIYFSLEYRREREGILLHYSTLDWVSLKWMAGLMQWYNNMHSTHKSLFHELNVPWSFKSVQVSTLHGFYCTKYLVHTVCSYILWLIIHRDLYCVPSFALIHHTLW